MHSREGSYEDYYEKMWTKNTTQDPNQVNLETDIVVQEVKAKFEERSQVGIKKYGTTLDRDDLSTEQWIEHAIEEAMDLTLYLSVIKKRLNEKHK